MFSTATVNGVVGSIKWGYYFAASINNYTVTVRTNRETKARTWRLIATVIQADAFKLTQRPLLFIAPHHEGEWHWVIRTIRFAGSDVPPRPPFTVTADLEAPSAEQKGTTIYVSATVSVRSA